MFVMPCAIVALLSLYLSFLCFGLLVRTRSGPYGLCHRPYTLAYIKGFGSPIWHVYACLLLCFTLVLPSLILGLAKFDTLSGFVIVWLHSTPMRPCLDVTIWDALPWCRLLRAYPSLFHSVRWCACHAYLYHPLASYASLHACLHVHAWVLLASVSSILQHNEAMEIRSKPTFVPHGYHLLFVYFLTCLLAFLFIFASHLPYTLPYAMLAMSILLVCFMPFCYYLRIFLPLLVYWFLVFAFACMHMELERTELGHDLLGASKKGADASLPTWVERPCQ